jgi:hypothetical protein
LKNRDWLLIIKRNISMETIPLAINPFSVLANLKLKYLFMMA